jgi:hypothetical protein
MLNLVYCLTMYIVLQVAYVFYKDFQILILSRLVSFPNFCKHFVLNQQLNLTDYSMSVSYGLLSSLIYTLFLYFSLVFIDLPVKNSKFKYFSFSMMT